MLLFICKIFKTFGLVKHSNASVQALAKNIASDNWNKKNFIVYRWTKILFQFLNQHNIILEVCVSFVWGDIAPVDMIQHFQLHFKFTFSDNDRLY